MKTRKILELVIVIILIASSVIAQKQNPPEGGKPKNFVFPKSVTLSLENGIQATLVQYGTIPKVNVKFVIQCGSVNEPSEQTWISKITADLLKEGTKNKSAKEIAEAAADMGGQISVYSGTEQTTLNGEVLSEFGSKLIELLADMIQNPKFGKDEFERIRNDYLRNLGVRKSQPSSVANNKFLQVIYADQPFGKPWPTEEALKGYNLEQVKNFYDKNYSGKSIHLYVVGKFNLDEMKNAIQKNLKAMKQGNTPVKILPKAASKRSVYIVDRPGAVQSTIIMGIPFLNPTQKDFSTAELTDAILGGAFSSRITSNIRENKGYTYSPYSYINNFYHDGYWAQVADVSTDVTGSTLKEIFYEINKMQQEAPSAGEFKGIQNYLAGNFLFNNTTRGGIVNQLQNIDFQDLGKSYLDNYVKNIYKVTPADVLKLMKNNFIDKAMTIVIVGDKQKIKDQVSTYGEIKE